MAVETYVYQRITILRLKELYWIIMFSIAIMIFTMLVWMSPGVSVYVFLHYFFKAGYELEVSKIAIFIKLLTELSELISDLPWSFQSINDLAVSISRLNRFMKSHETEIQSIRQPM